MQKSKKTLLGLIGLILVAIMTVFAYFLPAEGAFAEGPNSVTDTVRITVYGEFPSAEITSPATDYVTTSPDFEVGFNYSAATYVEFVLSYIDEEGNAHELARPRFDPEHLDSTYNYDSGSNVINLNLNDYAGYAHYVLSTVAVSPVGSSTGDAIEFYYIPARLEQKEEATNDPVVNIIYDHGVAKVEAMPVDENRQPLLDNPVIIEIAEPYDSGSQIITLPFTENDIPSGEYDVVLTTYHATDDGEYEVITSPVTRFPVTYVQPIAPDVPNTGRFLGELNIAKTDFVITGIIAFAGVATVAFIILGHKKKDYRKNIRYRK